MSGDPAALLVSTIARHFEGARVAGTVVDAGFARLACRLGTVQPFGRMHSAQLLFVIDGGELAVPVEVSMTSFGATVDEAIVNGACGWACSFGPVLYAALSDDAVEGGSGFLIVQRGRQFRVFVDGFDHVLHFAKGGGEDTEAARARFGAAPWFAFHALGRGTVALDGRRPQLLTAYVGETGDRRVVEIKLDGVVQPGFDDLASGAPRPPIDEMVSLRELAIIVPD